MDTNNRTSRPDCPSTAPTTLRPQLTSRATPPQHIACAHGRIPVQESVPTGYRGFAPHHLH